MGSPRVGIVILNWNRPAHTMACLRSLEQLAYPSCEVVVVDNGSAGDSVAAIRRGFPAVDVIENGHNLGFAGGNNVGIAHLLRRGADYVFLLNDDTEVASDLLETLIEVSERDPAIGILGPKICYFSQANVIWSAGGTIDRYGQPSHRRWGEVDDGSPEAVQDVDYVTGCAMLVKRAVVEKAGKLDERFFAYYEEAEWCTRARRLGFRVVYVPGGRVWHKIAQATRDHSGYYLYLMARNRLLYLKCSGASPWIILLTTASLLRTAASWSVRPRHKDMRPFAGIILRGVLDFNRGRFGPPPPLPQPNGGKW